MAAHSADVRILQPASPVGVHRLAQQVHQEGSHQWMDSCHLCALHQWVCILRHLHLDYHLNYLSYYYQFFMDHLLFHNYSLVVTLQIFSFLNAKISSSRFYMNENLVTLAQD